MAKTRKSVKIDYKKMHEGTADRDESSGSAGEEVMITKRERTLSSNSLIEEIKTCSQEEDEEINLMKNELHNLEEEAEKLKKLRQKEELRHRLQMKREEVKKLKGTSYYFCKGIRISMVKQDRWVYIPEENLREHQAKRVLDNRHRDLDMPGLFEPVDLVLTWVNGSDPAFVDEMLKHNLRNEGFMPKRYRDWGTLKYALRSVEMNADWIRHVYIVTNGQIPKWLNLKYPRVTLVTHQEIFKNKSHLPSFNSLAIESHIHRIPGLSRHFIYMNDDFFFPNKVEMKDFYTKETGFKIRFANSKLRYCSKKCPLISINNGICETKCNTSMCDWDGGDCQVPYEATAKSYDNLLKRVQPFTGVIMYTMFVYNKEFGSVERHVPAHVPYIIDKTVMDELQDRIPEEWDKTSASKVRSNHNLLYAYAYYHYLLRPREQIPGQKSLFPIATLTTSSEDIAYYGTGNATSLEKRLKILLSDKRKKFVCINDHMGLNEEEEDRTQRVMDSFFETLFPKPSRFEL